MFEPENAQASQAHSEVLREGCAPLVFILQHALFAPILCGANELEIGKRNAAVARRQGTDALAREMRVRRRLLKLAARFKIAQLARGQSEPELGFPWLFADLALHDHDASHGNNTKSLAILFLLNLRN